MFITDIRKSVPLDMSVLDFDPAHITHDTESHTIIIPLSSHDILDAATPFAYDTSSRCDWHWPDVSQTTVALDVDYSRSFLRFSLRIGVQPQESEIDTDSSSEWAEFECKRHEAIQRHIDSGGKEVTDTYPILLSEQEWNAVTIMLYTHFAIF